MPQIIEVRFKGARKEYYTWDADAVPAQNQLARDDPPRLSSRPDDEHLWRLVVRVEYLGAVHVERVAFVGRAVVQPGRATNACQEVTRRRQRAFLVAVYVSGQVFEPFIGRRWWFRRLDCGAGPGCAKCRVVRWCWRGLPPGCAR